MEKSTPLLKKDSWDILNDYIRKIKNNKLLIFIEMGLIKNLQICDKCQKSCFLKIKCEAQVTRNDLYWRCKSCRTKYSIFYNSVFSEMGISLDMFNVLCYLWCQYNFYSASFN